MKYFLLYIGMCLPLVVGAKEAPALLIQGKSISELKIQPHDKFVAQGEFSRTSSGDQVTVNLKEGSRSIIKTPSKNIRVVLEEAENIEIKDFQTDSFQLAVALKNGKVVVQNNKGNLNLSLDEGQVSVIKNQGQLQVHSYLAPVTITDWKGRLSVYSYSGAITLTESTGQVDIKSFSSPLHVEKSEGQLKFQCEKSNVRFKRFKGSISGYTNTGEVIGSITPKQGEVVTGSGRIHLYFAATKARVEAQSWEGKVFVPPYFYKDRAGGVYKAYGSIKSRGDEPGSIYLKSHSGNIAVL